MKCRICGRELREYVDYPVLMLCRDCYEKMKEEEKAKERS